jgi:hypothetical protein
MVYEPAFPPEQKKLLEIYQDKWWQIKYSAEPIERKKVAKAVKEAYRIIEEKEPKIIFCYSIYSYHGVTLPEKYGKLHPHQWRSQWILEEKNAEIKRVLIQGIGYDRICQELAAIELDSWQ